MNPKIISGIGTAVFVAIVIAILLAFGYNPPDPPIPEEGVEVNVGDSDYGIGTSPQPATMQPNNASPSAQEQVATQTTDPSIALTNNEQTGKLTNPAAPHQQQPESKEPELNPNANFPGMRNRNQNNGNGSQGVNTGKGDQGRPDGSPNSNNYSGQGQGDGVSYSLKGRKPVSLPKPDYKTNTQGTVVIRIWVNQQGKVVRVEYEPTGSNVPGGKLVEVAMSAARKARFTPDATAVEEQKGTITYKFTL